VINIRQQCDKDIGVCATRKWKAHTCNGKGISDSHGAPAAIYNTTSIYPSVADWRVDLSYAKHSAAPEDVELTHTFTVNGNWNVTL
jgi:hypothetical protein